MNQVAETPGPNQKVASGQAIITQGKKCNTLMILHQGKVALRLGTSPSESVYLYSIDGPAILVPDSLATGKTVSCSVVAETETIISVYPANRDSLLKIISGKPNIGILLLRSLIKETTSAFNTIQEANRFLGILSKFEDSLALAYSRVYPEGVKPIDPVADLGFSDPVSERARKKIEVFNQNEGKIPVPMTIEFLKTDHSILTGSKNDFSINLDRDEFNYLKKFVSLPQQIIAAVCQADPGFLLMTATRLGNMNAGIYHELQSVCSAAREISGYILSGDGSWVEKFAVQVDLSAQGLVAASQDDVNCAAVFVFEAATAIQNEFQRRWDSEPPHVSVDSLGKFQSIEAPVHAVEEENTGPSGPLPVADPNIKIEKEEHTDLARKIYQWSELPSEKFADFKKLMIQLGKVENPLDADSGVRKLRRQINMMFWELYKACAQKHFRQPQALPDWMQTFFNFALLDETLLNPEQVNYIFQNGLNQGFTDYPVHTALDWMELIYNKKVPTSVNELGLTFFELVKQGSKNSNWKRESDLPPDVDSSAARLNYEISNFFEINAKLTSGSIMNHFTLLNRFSINANIERALVTKEKMGSELDHLLKVDFSAFHREVLYTNDKIGISREFVQKQVIPNIILIPSAGHVFQFWQDKDSREKSSPGRINCQIIATAELKDMLISAVGAFRWELCKTIMGPDWNNISASSLTADFTDYVQFFKKNRDLSPEAKEKLGQEFKRFRDDRSRFVNDYITWVKFESDGTQRLNKVIRKILARHVPFTKEIRDNLLKLPSFTDIIQKSINLRKRKAVELEPRFKKYRSNNNGLLPDELTDTYKFFNMEY